MKSNDDHEIEELYSDDRYLNRVLRKYCLLPSAEDSTIALAGQVDNISLHNQGAYSSNEAALEVQAEASIAPDPVTREAGDPGLTQDGPGDEATSSVHAEQILQLLDKLNEVLWDAAGNVQKNASEAVKQFLQIVRESSSKAPIDDGSLLESLRNCEGIVASISRKYDKTRGLQTLNSLENIVTLNINALSHVHNWDATAMKLRKMLAAYQAFREGRADQRLARFFSSDSAEFNHQHAMELREILQNHRISKDQYLIKHPQFNDMATSLDEFMDGYMSILGDIAQDIGTGYFAPCRSLQDQCLDDRLPDPQELFPRYFELYKEILSPDDGSNRFLACLRSVIIKMLSLEFSTIWEEEHLKHQETPDYNPTIDDFTASLSNTIVSYSKLLKCTVASKKHLLELMFMSLEGQGLLRSPNEKLKEFTLDIMERSLANFDAIEEELENVSDEEFLVITTSVLESLDENIDDLSEASNELDLKQDLSSITIVPPGMLDRYINELNNMIFKHRWSPESDEGYLSVKESLSRFEKLKTHLSNIVLDSNGMIQVEGEFKVYPGLGWIYNRFAIWHMRNIYKDIMSTFYQAVDNHFAQVWARDLPKDVSTDLELEWHELLCSLMTNINSLRSILTETMVPIMQHHEDGTVLCKSLVANLVASEKPISDTLPRELNTFLKTADISQELETLFFEDSTATETAAAHIVKYIAARASQFMEAHCKATTSLFPSDAEPEISRNILLIGEYFTLLFPKYFEDEVLPLRILATAYNKFIDNELETLVRLNPSDPMKKKQYCTDISHLILISNYCGADVSESLELLME